MQCHPHGHPPTQGCHVLLTEQEAGAERPPRAAQGPTVWAGTRHSGLRSGSSKPSESRATWFRSWARLSVPLSQPLDADAVPLAASLRSRFLMRVLDAYGDDYRASQLTIVLEVSAASGRAVGGGRARARSLHLQPLPPTRTRAARARMLPPPATPRTSPQRKRGCPHPEGHPHPWNPAARPLVRGPVGARGGEHPGMDAERELRSLQSWRQCRWDQGSGVCDRSPRSLRAGAAAGAGWPGTEKELEKPRGEDSGGKGPGGVVRGAEGGWRRLGAEKGGSRN